MRSLLLKSFALALACGTLVTVNGRAISEPNLIRRLDNCEDETCTEKVYQHDDLWRRGRLPGGRPGRSSSGHIGGSGSSSSSSSSGGTLHIGQDPSSNRPGPSTEGDPTPHIGEDAPKTPDAPKKDPGSTDSTPHIGEDVPKPNSPAPAARPGGNENIGSNDLPLAHDSNVDRGWDAYYGDGVRITEKTAQTIKDRRETNYDDISTYDGYRKTEPTEYKAWIKSNNNQWRALGLNSKNKYEDISIKSTNNPNKEAQKTISQNFYSKDDRVIVAGSNFAMEDPYRATKDRGKQLPIDKQGHDKPLYSSELMFQTWKGVAGQDAVGNIRYIIRENVVNAGTKATVFKALEDCGRNQRVKETFKPNEGTDKEKDAYKALAGTDHGKASFNMIADHNVELGNVKEVWIHVWGKLSFEGKPGSMAFELIK